ncbi:Holliday junction resolvase RecU [Clostridium sp. D2Q-14]|uniref:Holliday junction resolvase RecU n=1 Tax=Anaeromonas gelatinilytica TaxID=2683194 RepID=UPI00193BAB39|nr:Holliday junction resolvase RecU [Anaeromonas gelatinilytica]
MILITRWNSLGHRGDNTENLVNSINELYDKQNLALITKVPTPIKVIKIHLGKIVEAFFEEKSTVDYNGIVQGYGICFDSKETNKNYLPLSNIHQHQIDYMNKFDCQKGYAFIICNFKKIGGFYLIPIETINNFWNNSKKGGRKSIPVAGLNDRYIVKMKNGLPDYLDALNKYIDDKLKNKAIV